MNDARSIMQFGSRQLAACLVALALAFLAPAAQAQTDADTSNDFTREEIQSVARASLAVERINERWAPRVQEAATQEEVNAVRREANAQMVEAIEAEGLDVNTYVEIIEMTQKDPELDERLMRYRRALE